MKQKLNILAFITTVLSASNSNAFVNRPAFSSLSTKKTQRLSMYLDGGAHHDLAILSAPILTSTIAIPSGTLSSASSALLDPLFEAEVFADISHVGLDLATFLRPATAMLRLSVVIGRVCAILSDYLPDGYMNPEEVVFQTLMLLIASVACLQSCLPLLLASTAKISLRDGRAYQNLFKNLGITWSQYKAMKAVALDWVQLEPHEQLSSSSTSNNDNDDDYMYLLYSGEAQLRLSCSGKSVQNVTANSGYNGLLLGELKFAQLLDYSSSMTKDNQQQQQQSLSSSPQLFAGATGATLVKIHMKKLKLLMDQDDELAESIRSLLVKGMHEKLTALLLSSSSSTTTEQ